MIKLPNLHVSDVSSFEFSSLKKTLIEAHIGESPIALALSPSANEQTTQEVINNVLKICDDLSCHHLFPYPIFIISRYSLPNSKIPVVKSRDEITNYYRLKIKKLKKRESNLLSKVKTYTTRINHYNIKDSFNSLKEHSQKHKELKSVCKEKAFYKDILTKLKKIKNK